MSRLDASPKPPRVKGGTPPRYARPPPLRRCFSPIFSFARSSQTNKWESTFKEGGRAPERVFLLRQKFRASFDGVRGVAPQINRCSGEHLFARWGGKIYSAPPPVRFAGANAYRWIFATAN